MVDSNIGRCLHFTLKLAFGEVEAPFEFVGAFVGVWVVEEVLPFVNTFVAGVGE